MSLQPGTDLDGRYRIVGALGSGAMGDVWLVVHLQLGSRHALKVVQAAHHSERLRAEGKAQASLRHPNLVPVTDVVNVPGGQGLVMDFVEGPTLEAWLARYRPTPDEAVGIARGILSGLEHVHRAGIVHRDLKPANILLDLHGDHITPRVTDFGIAKWRDDQGTRTGATMGTPAYMAPEQTRDAKHVDARSDLFSFGAVFYELLAGRRAFPGTDALSVLQRVALHDIDPLAETVPPLLRELVGLCLETTPGRRPASAAELLSRLPRPEGQPSTAALDAARPRDAFPQSAAPAPAPSVGATQALATGGASTMPGLPVDAPGASAVPRVVVALPAEPDAFIGRVEELAELESRLAAGQRLVTLLGFGGSGKTRLATHLAWRIHTHWRGGAWFVDLSDARSIEGITSAVAKTLDVPLSVGDPVQQLAHAIAGRGHCLVVLDNFEQVVSLAGATVGVWLDRAPEAQFLVTSRALLHLAGEMPFPLQPMAADPAAELFVDRAMAALPSFALRPADRPMLDRLLALLDGSPLAIELAAARLRIFSLAQLVERMGDQFKVLAGGPGRPDRQATLRGVLDWSWELLSTDERKGLTQLTVFEGGFTLEAAEAVLAVGNAWPADVIQALIDQSLVRQIGQHRLALLVPVQQYAAARLGDVERTEAYVRHGAWFARLGTDEIMEATTKHGGGVRVRQIITELDNLVAAARRAITRGDAPIAVTMLRAIWTAINNRGPFAVTNDLATNTLVFVKERSAARAKVLRILGNSYRRTGQLAQAQVHLAESLAIARDLGDRSAAAHLLDDLGFLHYDFGSLDQASTYLLEALQLHRETNDRNGEGLALSYLATVRLSEGQHEVARALYMEAHDILEEVGDRRMDASVLGRLGVVDLEQGRQAEARAHLEAALAKHRDSGNRIAEAHATGDLGDLYRMMGLYPTARAYMESALTLHCEVGTQRMLGYVHLNLAALDFVQGHFAEAAKHLNVTDGCAKEFHDVTLEALSKGQWAGLHMALGHHNAARSCIDEGEALLRAGPSPVGLGMLLCTRALVDHAFGESAAAQRATDEAAALAAQIGAGPMSELGQALTNARAKLATTKSTA